MLGGCLLWAGIPPGIQSVFAAILIPSGWRLAHGVLLNAGGWMPSNQPVVGSFLSSGHPVSDGFRRQRVGGALGLVSTKYSIIWWGRLVKRSHGDMLIIDTQQRQYHFIMA